MFDVIIIGGGVVGALTARELMKYKIKVLLLEKHSCPGMETSKANSGISHSGYDCKPVTNMAKFNLSGNALMERVCSELDVGYKQCGSLTLAFNAEEVSLLNDLYNRGKTNGVTKLSIISADEVWKKEPLVSQEVKAALYAQTAGILSSYKLAPKAAENARNNGAMIKTTSEVTCIFKNDSHFIVEADGKKYESKFIVNAAGVYADKIAKMAGDDSFEIIPRKGEYILFDKKLSGSVSHIIFQTPSKQRLGKGVLVAPTFGGPLLIGPTAYDTSDRDDVSTTATGIESVFESAQKSVPSIGRRDIIASFAGLRAIPSTGDFIIGESTVKNFINAAGMQSPGLTASPAVAKYLADLICDLNGGFEKNKEFNPENEKNPNIMELSEEELSRLIKEHPDYAKIICRCETVSEAEIKNAIKNGMHSLDAVKLYTRAGMGRCAGGFCAPRLLEIISAETGIEYTSIMKNDNGSYILSGETKRVDN